MGTFPLPRGCLEPEPCHFYPPQPPAMGSLQCRAVLSHPNLATQSFFFSKLTDGRTEWERMVDWTVVPLRQAEGIDSQLCPQGCGASGGTQGPEGNTEGPPS